MAAYRGRSTLSEASQLHAPANLSRHFLAELAVLVAGLLLLSLIDAHAAMPAYNYNYNVSVLSSTSLWLLLPVCVLVPVGEVLLWTLAFIEPSRRLLQAPVAGAVAGVVAYSVLFHFHAGLFSIVGSAWIGAVVNFAYLRHRNESLKIAFWHALGLRWCQVAIAILEARMGIQLL